MKKTGWGYSLGKSMLGIMGLIVVLVSFAVSYIYLLDQLPKDTLFMLERAVSALFLVAGIGWSIYGLMRRNIHFFYGLMAVGVGVFGLIRA